MRSEEMISSGLRSKFEETHCSKKGSGSFGTSDKCSYSRRIDSLLNKNVMTITYNEVNFNRFGFHLHNLALTHTHTL